MKKAARKLSNPYRCELKDELMRRQKRNASYSLRSFARDLGISAPTLSEVMNGQRHFRMRTASRAAERLRWNEEMIERMMREIREAGSKSNSRRRFAEEQAKQFNESFEPVAEWHLMAIAHLCRLPKMSAAPKEIAERLGISVEQAESAIASLKSTGYIDVQNGELKPGPNAAGPYIVTRVNEKVIRYQEDLLQKAGEAIRLYHPKKRLSLMRMFPLSPRDLHRFESLFWRFYQSVQKKSERTEGNELYCLSVQLFPLTRLSNRE